MRKAFYALLSLTTMAGVYLAFFHQGGQLPPLLEVDELDWDPSSRYAIVLDRDYGQKNLGDTTVVAKYNSDKRVSEYIRINGTYKHVLKTKYGLALKTNSSLLCLNGTSGTLTHGRCNDDVTKNYQRLNVKTEYKEDDDKLLLMRQKTFGEGFDGAAFLENKVSKTYEVPEAFKNFGTKHDLYISDVA